MKFLFALITSLSFSSILWAGCGSENCSDVLVEDISITSNGDLLFTTTGNESLMYCDPVGGTSIRVPKTAAAFQEFYAMLISAQKSESMINARINSDEYDCELYKLTANP